MPASIARQARLWFYACRGIPHPDSHRTAHRAAVLSLHAGSAADVEECALNRRTLLLRLELGSNPEFLCVVRGAVEQLAESVGFSGDQSRDVTRAVDEALANIIRHAYHNQPNRPIEITCYRGRHSNHSGARECLEIVLEDRGTAARRENLCGRSLDDVRPGGLGMHFIQHGVDAMEYRRVSRRNRLRLLKYLPSAAEAKK